MVRPVRVHRLLTAMAVVTGLFFSGGCSLVSVSDTSHYSDGEGRLPENLFAEIQPNLTTKSWILTHFGEPVSIQETVSGQKIYNYQFTRIHRKNASLIFVVRYRGVEQNKEYFHVLFQDDLVKKHWIDLLPIAQIDSANG